MIHWITLTAKDLYASLGLWCCIGLLPGLSVFGILFLGWWLFHFPSWGKLLVWYVTIVLLTPLFTGVSAQAFRTVRGEEIGLPVWMMDTYRLAWRSVQLMAAWLLTALVLLVNAWFYWRYSESLGRLPGLLSGSLLVMWLWTILYLPPLLNEHFSGIYANRQKQGTLWILYRAFLLMLSAPAVTLGAAGVILLWTALNVLIPIGLLTVWMPGILLFTAHLERDLLSGKVGRTA